MSNGFRTLQASSLMNPATRTKMISRPHSKGDLFSVQRFHHVEFWCPDATNAYKRFQAGLGMPLVAKSDQSTENSVFASYVLQSEELVFAFTAPYASCREEKQLATYNAKEARRFVQTHGFAARAVGVTVDDAAEAFQVSVDHGAVPVLQPVALRDKATGQRQVISEVGLFDDAVLRYVSGDYSGPYLASYSPIHGPKLDFGFTRLDHAVGNVPKISDSKDYVTQFTGFHDFAGFSAEDLGLVESGLNNIVLANNNEFVLLVINEPTHGTQRKSQIQTYLEQHGGPGIQHLALKTNDIFSCLRKMKSQIGGFEFAPPPTRDYYRRLPSRIGDGLTPEQYKEVEELGISVDKDEQGILLQIFTKPVSDRATLFLEVIQRIGCQTQLNKGGKDVTVEQKGGCGGFGNGNIAELFRSVEEYVGTLKL